jgi:hypothetical protein
MSVMEQLRAWGVAHAQARSAESAARENRHADASGDLRRQAKFLRDRADRLHREVYHALDATGRAESREG